MVAIDNIIMYMDRLCFNSFAGKANYYGTHVVQKKVLCVAGKQLTLYDQETTDQYVVDCKVLTAWINRVALL